MRQNVNKRRLPFIILCFLSANETIRKFAKIVPISFLSFFFFGWFNYAKVLLGICSQYVVKYHNMILCIYVIKIYFLTIHQLNVHRKHDIMNMKIHDIQIKAQQSTFCAIKTGDTKSHTVILRGLRGLFQTCRNSAFSGDLNLSLKVVQNDIYFQS